MNLTLAQNDLAFALGDTTHDVYSTSVLTAAILRAVGAYSQWKKCLRRIGSGQLMFDYAAGVNTIDVIGGLFTIGNSITLGVSTANTEVCVISSITPILDGSEPTGYTALGLSSVTTKTHRSGDIILPVTNPVGQCGLAVQNGVDSYPLPYDFISVESSSFDIATGAKLTYRKGNGFYDATSIISDQLSGTGFGRSATFGPSSAFGYPMLGDPFNNPNGGFPSLPGILYRFYISDAPYLRISPVPVSTATLSFDYYGCHTVQSVPSSDMELVLLYGRYATLSARANAFQEETGGDVRIEEYDVRSSRNAEALRALAQEAYTAWDDRTRMIPYITSG